MYIITQAELTLVNSQKLVLKVIKDLKVSQADKVKEA